MESFASLSAVSLQAIAGAIRSGRLGPSFSAIAVRSYTAREVAGTVADDLQRLADEGMNLDHLATLLETLAKSHPTRDEAVDLVWTGPEAPGSLSRDTSVVVQELFRGARQSVMVAGYAVYQGRHVFRALADRMDGQPALKVRMFLNVPRSAGDTSAESEILQRFAHKFKAKEWPGSRLPEIFYDPRAMAAEPGRRASLHAKCIVVDGKAVFISSANFTEAAQVRNIEVGLLVRSAHLAEHLTGQFDGLVETGQLEPVPGF